MASGRLALCLVDADNDFQQVACRDGEAAARRAGLAIEVHWSGDDLSAQLGQLRQILDSPSPPEAILVMAVRDRGLGRLARDATAAGIHWVFLNRSEDDIESLRRERPSLVICQVYPDEVETGRVQGEIVKVLLPKGGTVVQMQGSKRSLAARDRTAGLREVLAGEGFRLVDLEAGWSEDEGHDAFFAWLRVAVQANMRFDLVACHNDPLALGARRALEDVARDLDAPTLTSIPIVGCDGTPSMGQAMVKDGRLAATVELPRSTGPAVLIVAKGLAGGERPPAIVTLHPSPFPGLEELRDRRS
jgi:ABC-type sugar transport system substrate-binding protein